MLQRQDSILRLERFWALANLLARPDDSGSVRGITYVKDRMAEIQRTGETRTTAKYQLLLRQRQYGAIGMYGNVADGMRFLNREDFTLTPALGEKAAEAFSEETELPAVLRRAVRNDGDVSLATLKAWGERAHVAAEVKPAEANCLYEALHSNPVRSRMADLLKLQPPKNEQETELNRLSRIVLTLKKEKENVDLLEAGTCILEYEACYQLAMLAFERILWLCRHHAVCVITIAELERDTVFKLVRERLPAQVTRFLASLDNATDLAFRHQLEKLLDVRRFLEEANAALNSTQAFVDVLISRHSDVQHGKFDGGRRKMPWLECSEARLRLTMTRAGGLNREATKPEDILPHPYRTGAADNLILTSGEGVKS